MSDPLTLLQGEHRQIERVFKLLERHLEEPSGEVNLALLQRAVGFLGIYVEGLHMAKESSIFKELQRVGLHHGDGLFMRMADEHAMLHKLIGELRRDLKGIQSSKAEDLKGELELLRLYIRMHRSHTAEEESSLFPLQRRLLTNDAKERVRSEFARIEARRPPMAEEIQRMERLFGAVEA